MVQWLARPAAYPSNVEEKAVQTAAANNKLKDHLFPTNYTNNNAKEEEEKKRIGAIAGRSRIETGRSPIFFQIFFLII